MLTFRDVFNREMAYIYRSVVRLGVSERDAEDVAQEVFLRVHARFDAYDRSRPLRPWLFAFARAVVANHLRLARHREMPSGAAAEETPSTTDPERAALQRERRGRVLKALAQLSFERRAVLVMHELDGFTAPEISEALDVPLNTVYSRIRAARADLRELLESQARTEGGAS